MRSMVERANADSKKPGSKGHSSKKSIPPASSHISKKKNSTRKRQDMLHGDELESHEEKHEDVIEERTIYRA